MNFFDLIPSFIASLCIVAAENTGGLHGASGNMFHVDHSARRFELLKETEYDPKTEIGKSRFTVHWEETTEIIQVTEPTDFTVVPAPSMAEFYGLDATNVRAANAGEAFVARVAIVVTGATKLEPSVRDRPSFIGPFTPDKLPGSRSGTIMLNAVPVPVSLAKNHAKITHCQPIDATALESGFWRVDLEGAQRDGRFVASRMQVSPLPDPRITDDPRLPRVLVIGDSISMNYHEAAKTALHGVANYHRNDGNAFSSSHGVNNTELWLGNFRQQGLHWDVIQFNHGLHDLKQAYDRETDTFGAYAVPIERFQTNLEQQIAILKQTGATLIWCSTTPIPNDIKSQYSRRKGAEILYNQAALEVMRRHPEILVNDLHGVVANSPVYDRWRTTKDVHFYATDEQKTLGEAVASVVKQALKNRNK
jgi:hypothetical protein